MLMAKSPSQARISLLFPRLPKPIMAVSSPFLSFPLPRSSFKLLNPSKTLLSTPSPSSRSSFFSTTSTPFPLQYEMIVSRPTQSSLTHNLRRPPRISSPQSDNSPESEASELPTLPNSSELGFEDWVDRKLSSNQVGVNDPEMNKSKRKYYSKRRKRLYGSDSDDERGGNREGYVELQPEVVELRTLHKREEELYFYDTFAYPWEKEKHYKMVYQLEKKYYPDHCLDKAFLQPGQLNVNANASSSVKGKAKGIVGKSKEEEKAVPVDDAANDKGLVFFDEEKDEAGVVGSVKGVKVDVSEKKVEEFFKCLKKVPNRDTDLSDREPYIVTRNGELPPTWDGPSGTVVLVNKPKG